MFWDSFTKLRMIDFEIAMLNAIKEKLQCKVVGCRFHLGQSWQRQIGKKGLATHYTYKDSPEGSWLRGLFGLFLIPDLIVGRVFERYCKTPKGKSNLLKDFERNIYKRGCALPYWNVGRPDWTHNKQWGGGLPSPLWWFVWLFEDWARNMAFYKKHGAL